ncbi:MAG: hypothetical protein NC350_05505 [Corallococcus sp.]|nr:hypothetical protein [Corallococcus sp.]
MEKTETKSFFIESLKGGLFAFILSTIFVLLLALIAKLFTIPANVLPIVNQVLKAVAVGVGVGIAVKNDKLLFKGLLSGAIFSILNLMLFLILGGEFKFAQVAIDLAVSLAVGVVVALIKSRKK